MQPFIYAPTQGFPMQFMQPMNYGMMVPSSAQQQLHLNSASKPISLPIVSQTDVNNTAMDPKVATAESNSEEDGEDSDHPI